METTSSLIEKQFQTLHESSLAFVRLIPAELLYKAPRNPTGSIPIYSAGECLLRSAAVVEQTFGGLTANLWDDPFEWTLPEALSTPADVEQYLVEVAETRSRGFSLIHVDSDLYREVAIPSGGTALLIEILLRAVSRAWHHQGRAFSVFRMLSDASFPLI